MKQADEIKMHPKDSAAKLSQGSVRLNALTVFNPLEIMEKAETKANTKKKVDNKKKA